MAEVEIKHAQFLYYEEVEVTDPETGETNTTLNPKIAMFGDVVDIPRQEDIDKGEEHDAFVTEEDRQAAAEAEVEALGGTESAPTEFGDHDALVEWIRDEKPTAAQVVDAAGGDPDKAGALMDAEEEASGGQPRKSVMEPLEKVASG